MSKNITNNNNNNSSNYDTTSTASNSSSDKQTSATSTIRMIEDVPVFDLTRIEFLEKLGEGAFGKVRLCKIGQPINPNLNRSAPTKISTIIKNTEEGSLA